MKRFISSSLAVRIAIAVAAVIALAYIVTHAAVPVGTGLSSPVMTNFNARYFTITLAAGTTPTNVIQLNLPMGPGSPDLPGDIINIVNGTNLWTNDLGNLRPRVVQTQLNATNIVSHQNLVSQGAFDITTTYSGNLVAGSNSVPVLNNSYILLSSDFAATDPTLRTIYLSGVASQGQLLFLENILGNGGTTTSAFQLTNGTVCYDNPGMTVALQNGSWSSTNAGESLFLQFDGITGWREVSRFFGPLGGSGNSLWTNDAGILHPKDLTLPLMITNQLQFGPGTTNIIYRSGDMIVISNQTPHLKLEGLGGSFEFSWDLNTANISASGGANTVVGGPLESQTHFPGASSIYDLGLNNNIGWWRSLWQRGTNFNNAIPWNLTNYYRAADYMDGGTKVFDIQSWTNGAAGPVVGFSFRTNGVEVFNVTGTGGPSSGANWVASGTTNSTLAGTATATNGFRGVTLYPFVTLTRLIFEGDSLTVGPTGPTSWPSYATNAFLTVNQATLSTNAATSADTIANMLTDYPTQVAPFKPASGTNAVLFVWAGINDIKDSHDSAATVYNNLSNYWSGAKADGFTVVAFTITHCLTDSAEELVRASVNSAIRRSTNWDYLMDVDAILPNTYGTTPDDCHYTAAYNQYIAAYARTVLTTASNQISTAPINELSEFMWMDTDGRLQVSATNSDFSGGMTTLSGVQIFGNNASPINGPGGIGSMELDYADGAMSYITVYRRSDSTWMPLTIRASSLDISPSGSSKLIVTNTGVGIMTNAPSEALEVLGNVKASGNLTLAGTATATNGFAQPMSQVWGDVLTFSPVYDAASNPFRISYAFTPNGDSVRSNLVIQLGFNSAIYPGGGSRDLSRESSYFMFEDYYWDTTYHWTEFHWDVYGTNNSWTVRPFNLGTRLEDQYTSQTYTFDQCRFIDRATSDLNYQMWGKNFYIRLGSTLNWDANNANTYQQLNAAGLAYKKGPWLDSSDHWRIASDGLVTDFGGAVNVTSNLVVSGSVGIKTNAPSEALEVLGNIKASGSVNASSYQINGINGWTGFWTNMIPGVITQRICISGGATTNVITL